jgi:hypothetical protein
MSISELGRLRAAPLFRLVFLHHQRAVAQANVRSGILLDGGAECSAGNQRMVKVSHHADQLARRRKLLDAERVIFKAHSGMLRDS